MGLIALLIALRSNFSYKKTKDSSLLFFSLAFVSFALYLLVLAFLSYLFKNNIYTDLFDVGYAIGRFFVVLGIVSVFQTSVYQSNSFFSRNRVLISILTLTLGAVAFYLQIATFQEVRISPSQVIIQPVEIIPAIIAALLTYGISISWLYLTIKQLPAFSSKIFKIKIYLIALGGVLLATGDTMYVFSGYFNDSPYGPIINLIGYILLVFAVSITNFRTIWKN